MKPASLMRSESVLQVTIGDATKTLASRIWDTWIPFGTESETEVTTVASCRVPLADILAAGKPSFSSIRGAKCPRPFIQPSGIAQWIMSQRDKM